jgi:hypothetical protein
MHSMPGRTRRGVRAILKWASLGLLVLVLASWMLSGWWRISCSLFADECFIALELEGGVCTLRVIHDVPATTVNLQAAATARKLHGPAPASIYGRAALTPSPARWYWWGKWDVTLPPDHAWSDTIALPLWPAAFAMLLVVLVWHFNPRAAYRRRRDRCVHCGYDRRGLAAEAPCPECGRVSVLPTQ